MRTDSSCIRNSHLGERASPLTLIPVHQAVLRHLAAILLLCWSSSVPVPLIRDASAQYNHCLQEPGCYHFECCFNVLANPPPSNCHSLRTGCVKAFPRDCCQNNIEVRTAYGRIVGYSQLLDDPFGFRRGKHRYLHTFLGIPYAKPPLRQMRFRRPQPLDESNAKYDATFYRPACPQRTQQSPALQTMRLLANPVDEDCLYLNIFVARRSASSQQQDARWPDSAHQSAQSDQSDESRRFPIMLFFNGDAHTSGSAAQYPGNILAQTADMLVVTANYRLNAFGFLSTEDDEAPGNYGLWDQLAVLEYLRENAANFHGDPSRITLVGHGSAAGDVALHMMSQRSGLGQHLFQRAVLMSGSDLTFGSFVQKRGEAKRFAQELGVQVGCRTTSSKTLLDCLRGKGTHELIGAAHELRVHERDFIAKAWSPNVDGEFITDFPRKLREQGKFMQCPVIGGLAMDEGSNEATLRYGLTNSQTGKMSASSFHEQMLGIARADFAINEAGVASTLQSMYSDWSDLGNDSRRLAVFRELWTDRYFSSGLDETLIYHANADWKSESRPARPLINRTHMYLFKYKSANDPKTRYAGAYHASTLHYLFGFPYITGGRAMYERFGFAWPGFDWARLDRNMSDYMMFMFANFVRTGNVTPTQVRNFTWDTFRPDNHTYFILDLNTSLHDFDLKQDYRVYPNAFWRHYYPLVLKRYPQFTTPTPTPFYLIQYKQSLFSLTGLSIMFIIVLIVISIVYIRIRRSTLK